MSASTSTIGVLRRNPLFVRLWGAQVVSMAGDWLNRMALLVLIGELAGPDAQLGIGLLYGLETALRLLPTAVFASLAGPVADRLPRRLVMVAADLLRAGVVLGFLLVDEPSELPLLYALVVAQMGLAIFFESARSGALPSLVARNDLHAAHALSSATWSAMLALGAALGGVVTHAFGPDTVFVLDAGTYLLSALLLVGLRLPPPPKQEQPFRWADIATFADMRRGLAHVRDVGVLPAVLAKTFWWPAGGYLTLLAVAGELRFGAAVGTAVATSRLYTARGLGTGLGPILARRRWGSSDAALRLQIGLGFVCAALFYAAFGFAHDIWWAMAAVFAAHMGGSTIWVASGALWQMHVHDAYRGRVHALDFTGMTLSFAAGGLFAGVLHDATGSLELVSTVLSGCLLLSVAAWWRWSRGLGAERAAARARELAGREYRGDAASES